jgi:hypothetical protein
MMNHAHSGNTERRTILDKQTPNTKQEHTLHRSTTLGKWYGHNGKQLKNRNRDTTNIYVKNNNMIRNDTRRNVHNRKMSNTYTTHIHK